MNRISKKLLLALVLAVALSVTSCKKYEDGPGFSLITKKNRITGEWELVKRTPGGIPAGETIIFEFDKDGDFTYTYDYGTYSYSYAGEWEFEDQKENLEIIIDGSVVEFEILRLTNKELNLENTYSGYVQEWEFEKQ